MNDGERLLSAYLDRDLASDEAAGLLAAVRDDADLRRRLLGLARVERLLASELGPIALEQEVSVALARLDQPWVDGVMRDVRSVSRRSSPRRRARRHQAQRWVPVAMAALLAVAVAAAWAVFSHLSPSAITVPPVATASAALQLDGVQVGPGTAVPAGAVVACRVASGWDYPDGTSIVLAAGGEARIALTAEGGKSIELRHGELSAAVVQQAPGSPLVAHANGLEATVVGTRFSLSAGEEPRLAVAEGRVRARAAGFTDMVGPGQSFTAAAAGPRFTVWAVDGAWNEVVSGGRILAGGASSVPTSSVQRNPSFEPDQYICVQSDRGNGDRSLFSVPAGAHLRLRVRSERAGEAQLTLEVPAAAEVRERIHGSRRFSITPEWRDLVLAPTDLDGGNGLPVALPVRTICLWGFAAGTVELAELAIERRSTP